jgi:predicted small secreted protein
MTKGFFWTAAVLALATLAGCATVEGAGRDISAGASTVQGWFN